MRILKARFEGFRLLSGIEIEFSTDSKRNITVIRAANESGKTTMLTAMQWGLYGDDALPRGYLLRRMDLEAGEPDTTRVEIEYEIGGRTSPKRYRLVRRADTLGRDGERITSKVELYEINAAGLEPLPSPTNHIQQHLPGELREVFFTDGDRALSFIEGAKSTQQHKVRAAIERMMGLSLLEATIDHVKTVERQLRTRFGKEAGSAETRTIEQDIQNIENNLPVKIGQLNEAKEKVTNLTEQREQAERDLENVLIAGNREELSRDLVSTRQQREKLEEQRKSTEKRQAELLSSELLSQHMMADRFKKAGATLDKLRQKGQIPNKTVPILEDRLEHSDCICGETLDDKTPEGARRRRHIEELIRDSREADDLRSKVSDLYYQAKPLFSDTPKSWSDLFGKAFGERQQIHSVYKTIGEKEAEIEAKLEKIPDVNVQRLREIKSEYDKRYREELVRQTELERDIKTLKENKIELERKFHAASSRVAKGEKISREIGAATDIRSVVEASLERMKTIEVKAVSARMNEHFLSMIGADNDGALITKAEITSEFRIVVYGRRDLELDPSMDLNGASRRALTISFVLALSEVSGVEGPNVVDTPLGMMSGFVKSEVVRTAANNSSQLILFLTHDEIKGCEEILDERAVVAATLTNPAHFPRILNNDPGTTDAIILQCKCDHRSVCNVCERRESSTQEFEETA